MALYAYAAEVFIHGDATASVGCPVSNSIYVYRDDAEDGREGPYEGKKGSILGNFLPPWVSIVLYRNRSGLLICKYMKSQSN